MIDKIFSFVLCIIILFSALSSNVDALSPEVEIQLHTSDVIKNGQGFNSYIGFASDTLENLGAFRLTISYDEEYFSFMYIKLCDSYADDYWLKSYDQDGIVSIVFVTREAIDLSSDINDIFYIRFKAVGTQADSEYNFKITVMEVVDFDGLYIDEDAICNLTVAGASSSSSSVSSETADSTASASSSSSDQDGETDQSGEGSETTYLDSDSSEASAGQGETIILQSEDEMENMFPFILAGIVVVIVVAMLCFHIGHKRGKNILCPGEYRVEDKARKKK